jgi:hypothetical protein
MACIVEAPLDWRRFIKHHLIAVGTTSEARSRVSQVERAAELTLEVDENPGLQVPRVDEVTGGEDEAIGHDVRFGIGGRRGVTGPRAPRPVGIAVSIGGERHRCPSEINALGLGDCGKEENVAAGDGGGGAEGAVLHFAWLREKVRRLWRMKLGDAQRRVWERGEWRPDLWLSAYILPSCYTVVRHSGRAVGGLCCRPRRLTCRHGASLLSLEGPVN